LQQRCPAGSRRYLKARSPKPKKKAELPPELPVADELPGRVTAEAPTAEIKLPEVEVVSQNAELKELQADYPGLIAPHIESWNNRAKAEFKARTAEVLGLLEDKIGSAVRDMNITVTDTGVASYYPDNAIAFSILAPQSAADIAKNLARAYLEQNPSFSRRNRVRNMRRPARLKRRL
jgi:hypothetical protein